MFGKIATLFKIPELRRKILLTVLLLAVYRMGFSIPLPFIDQQALADQVEKMKQGSSTAGQVMQIVALFSASGIGGATIFGLGIMPYISASIIVQLLATVYPPWEQLQKGTEADRRKLNDITRLLTVAICLLQSYFWIAALDSGTLFGGGGENSSVLLSNWNGVGSFLIGAIIMTTGTVFLMWIGEQIDAYGIGNGISLLIMAGILARMPEAGWSLIAPRIQNGIKLGTDTGIEILLVLAFLFVFVVVWVVAMTNAERRIPIQSAKHVRGRRVMGGDRRHLPLKVNTAGVMPIIFASSLLMIPLFLFGWLSKVFPGSTVLTNLGSAFSSGRGFVYTFCYIVLIYFFCYFWTAITFRPKDVANNLKDYGSFIPGYRPGVRTERFLESVMTRITYVGAAFLAIVAIIPTIIASALGISFLVASFYGGTGLLIVVSVCLDLVKKIDGHLQMRNYKGLLDTSKS